ncbi:MAG: hypothetical protein HYU56_01665 [Candidatus Aenigmarchaeota archaeon]|nr:hypothetical protein [Candidatus Aenigmarchaeota archaeon]
MKDLTSNTHIGIENLINKDWIISQDKDTLVIRKPPKGPIITIPKIIQIEKNLAWCLGFYIAEGTKVSYCIGISNCELSLIKRFQEEIRTKFGIDYSSWRAYCKSTEKTNKKIKYYINILKTKKVKSKYFRGATKDNIEIRFNNTLFALIFNEFVKQSLEIIYQDKGLLLEFLKGYEIGDGSIIQRSGFLYGIVITVKDEEMKNFLMKSFIKLYNKKPKERITKGSYEISFTGIIPLIDVVLDRHFDSTERQWKKLISCFIKKQYTRSHIRYWKALCNSSLPVNDIAKLTNRSHWAVRDAMNKDTKLRLVTMEKKIINGRGHNHNYYSLTDKCKELLKIVEEVR